MLIEFDGDDAADGDNLHCPPSIANSIFILLRWCCAVLKVYFWVALCQIFDAILLCNITLHDYTRVSAEYVESNQNVIVIFRCFVRKPSRRLFGLI